MLLANRMARLFVVAYLVLLHLLVVAMLYIWSAGGGSSAEIDIAALAPLMAPSAQVRIPHAVHAPMSDALTAPGMGLPEALVHMQGGADSWQISRRSLSTFTSTRLSQSIRRSLHAGTGLATHYASRMCKHERPKPGRRAAGVTRACRTTVR